MNLVVLKNEMKRSFFNKGMVLSLLMGIGIILWHQVQYVWNPAHELNNGVCMESVYYNWIGGSCAPMQSFLFYFTIPLIAVLPCGCTYFDDLKSGYIFQMSTRGVKKDFLLSKFISVFLSGGFVIGVSLTLSFLMTAMKFPMLLPEPIMGLGPDMKSFDINFYYQYPFLHTVLFIFIDALFAGGLATISLVASFWMNHKFIIAIAPFIFYYFLFSLDQLLGGNDYSPNYFLIPGFSPHLIIEFVLGVFMMVIVFTYFYSKGKKVE